MHNYDAQVLSILIGRKHLNNQSESLKSAQSNFRVQLFFYKIESS